MGGFLAAFLPSLIGMAGSLFKGKKQQYAMQQTPQQGQAYNQLLQMIQGRMGRPSAGMQPGQDAMSLIYQTFFGRPYQAQAPGQNIPRIPTSPQLPAPRM